MHIPYSHRKALANNDFNSRLKYKDYKYLASLGASRLCSFQLRMELSCKKTGSLASI